MSGIDLRFLAICWGEFYHDLLTVADHRPFIDADTQVSSLPTAINSDMLSNPHMANMWQAGEYSASEEMACSLVRDE